MNNLIFFFQNILSLIALVQSGFSLYLCFKSTKRANSLSFKANIKH